MPTLEVLQHGDSPEMCIFALGHRMGIKHDNWKINICLSTLLHCVDISIGCALIKDDQLELIRINWS